MLIDKTDLPIGAMDFMNEVHEEDREIINELFALILTYEDEETSINQENINVKYKQWIQHTLEHFEGEEVKMRELNFPPYAMHKGEHDKALAQIESVFTQWNETQNIKILKTYFIEVMPNWLVHHIQTMDTVTASFFRTGLSPCSL
jgi:hemerythrin